MPIDQHRGRALTLIAMICVPLHLPSQELLEFGGTDESMPHGRALRTALQPSSTIASWNSSTRWNTRLKVTSFHSSTTGWATVAAPAAGHRFSSIFSMEVSMPIYLYRLANSRLPNPPPGAAPVEQRCEPGDLVFAVHARFMQEQFHYELTGSMTVPTGDEIYGFSTGRVTST